MAKKSFPLRIDEQVLDLLRQWADDEFRSVNGQMEYLLREALREGGRLKRSAPEPAEIPDGPERELNEES